MLAILLSAPALGALSVEPIKCPAGAPVGSFQLLVTNGSGAPRMLETVNQLLPGYKVDYHPEHIKGPDKKKARISLVLVPSDKGKVDVLEPKPADKDAEWSVPFDTQIAALVYGPEGLDKGKVAGLVKKNEELIGQLADYAQKTQDTESLIQAITQEKQGLESGESVNAAVASFASQYSGATKLDRTQPMDAQMAALVRGLSPAVTAYDPLAPDPTQRAAQTASIAAAVAGLFLGTDVGLGASAGALLLNMHSLFFPKTEFRSAFGQPQSGQKNVTGLCGSSTSSVSRTQLAYLWATRFPDVSAPALSLEKTEHVALSEKTAFPLDVKAREWKIAARVQDWRLVSADGKAASAISAKVDTTKKTIELDLTDTKVKAGAWKLEGTWDWTPVKVAGTLEVHELSSFAKAKVAPASQDHLIQGAGKVNVWLTGDDFEFVTKLELKNRDDKFAQPSSVAFLLPKGLREGPQTTLETQVDTGSLTPGNYEFLVAQSDGDAHAVPFKVLPAPPRISNLPLLVNTGQGSRVVLHGDGLDRIESLSADGAKIELDEPATADERGATVTLDPSAKKGKKLTLRMKVKDFDQPIGFENALVVAGPRPVINNVGISLPPGSVLAAPGEIPADSAVSFELSIAHATDLNSLRLYCDGEADAKAVVIRPGDASDDSRLRQEGPGSYFLAFNSGSIGQPGCEVMASVSSAANGNSVPKKLGTIILFPRIDSFEVTDQKASDNSFYGEIKGQNLESIAKVGWDDATGMDVSTIPAPAAGGGTDELLRVTVPWPAPAPHSPLFIWLRGETKGRPTTVKW